MAPKASNSLIRKYNEVQQKFNLPLQKLASRQTTVRGKLNYQGRGAVDGPPPAHP